MKPHTTNYKNTFIIVADDCSAIAGEIPPIKGAAKSLANIQYEILNKDPYRYTSDDVLFQVYAVRIGCVQSELQAARTRFFSKGQPCFRASPLTKRYGWGVHCNPEGKIALFGVDTAEYHKLVNDKSLKILKAMRSKRLHQE